MRRLSVAVACFFAVGCSGAAVGGSPCRTTQECNGGSFCDRGMCAATDTQVFGHGYGAQCLPEEAYGSPRDLMTHCRGRACVDGHCSSCIADSECAQPGDKCIAQPGIAGKTCAAMSFDQTNNREDVKPELPATPRLEPADHDCERASDCRGDEFCDRGRCATTMLDPFGHGYGAFCRRVEPPNQRSTCWAYICVNDYCSSCLGDSECYPEAPHCIESPIWPDGKVCSPEPASHWYDEAGKLKPEREAEYAKWLSYYRTLQMSRKQVGLPVDADYSN